MHVHQRMFAQHVSGQDTEQHHEQRGKHHKLQHQRPQRRRPRPTCRGWFGGGGGTANTVGGVPGCPAAAAAAAALVASLSRGWFGGGADRKDQHVAQQFFVVVFLTHSGHRKPLQFTVRRRRQLFHVYVAGADRFLRSLKRYLHEHGRRQRDIGQCFFLPPRARQGFAVALAHPPQIHFGRFDFWVTRMVGFGFPSRWWWWWW